MSSANIYRWNKTSKMRRYIRTNVLDDKVKKYCGRGSCLLLACSKMIAVQIEMSETTDHRLIHGEMNM